MGDVTRPTRPIHYSTQLNGDVSLICDCEQTLCEFNCLIPPLKPVSTLSGCNNETSKSPQGAATAAAALTWLSRPIKKSMRKKRTAQTGEKGIWLTADG